MASIIMWNSPRPDKKLLVLDIDHTLAEYKVTERIVRRRINIRNHLEYFLTVVYKYYDIAIWSATPIQFIIEKLTVLNMLSNKNFKLLFGLDVTYMVPINIRDLGCVLVKPLEVIWENFEQFDKKNTIIVDDQEQNFYRNPKNGIKVVPYYKEAHYTDIELISLAKYLKDLANTSTNFSEEDLEDWKSYVPLSHRLV